VGRKKLVRKAEPPSKRGIAWPRWTGFRGMTLRSWLELLVVPLALVVIGLVFTMLQDARQQDLENQRAQQAQKIENQRSEAERELAEQRAQDEALQAYLDQMSGLLLERDLRTSKEDSEVRTLARARTLTVLGRLDPSRKTAVMQFLVEADLVQRVDGREPIIRLAGADLRGARVRVSGAPLSIANLHGADLQGADLHSADLSGAKLSNADLSVTLLSNAELYDANLNDAKLWSALMNGAKLSRSKLNGVDLRMADLSNANLSEADLSGAKLYEANLSDAKGITNEKLEQQVGALERATMPNGQKYEDWLKSQVVR
jgi:uncharacterized protein YjbI with pentapeptide repeats